MRYLEKDAASKLCDPSKCGGNLKANVLLVVFVAILACFNTIFASSFGVKLATALLRNDQNGMGQCEVSF